MYKRHKRSRSRSPEDSSRSSRLNTPRDGESSTVQLGRVSFNAD